MARIKAIPDHSPPAAPPPLWTVDNICSHFNGYPGRNRILDALASPGAPKPVLGGGRQGSKALYSREEVIAWAVRISKPGKWPVRVRGAA